VILAVLEVVAGAAVPVAEALDRAVHGRRADPDARPGRQHLAQVADAPDRDRQPVRLGAGCQRLREERQRGGVQLRRPARPRFVGEAPAAVRQEPRPPGADAIRAGLEQASDRGDRVALGHEQQGVRPPAQPRVGVGSGKAPQLVGARGKGGAHGSTSAPPPHTPVQDFCRST
jgi:hypothetical protein